MISSHRAPRGVSSKPGAAIGSAGCAVEADHDRNGVINQLDYDISIADDGKSRSGGVGEAGLFSRGVRNSVGYCGYIFNEDSGLYTVRFRTYSPTLGRWLERDPAGYVDGMGLYEYVRGGAIDAVDSWGLQTAPPIDDPGPFDLGWEWLVNPDDSPEQREFGPEHSFTKQLREHEHIAEVQRKLRDLLADTCDSCSQDGALSHGRARVGETFGGSFDGQELDPETGKLRNRGPGLSYSLAGWQGVPKYLRDYSVITSFGLTGSLAVTFLVVRCTVS